MRRLTALLLCPPRWPAGYPVQGFKPLAHSLVSFVVVFGFDSRKRGDLLDISPRVQTASWFFGKFFSSFWVQFVFGGGRVSHFTLSPPLTCLKSCPRVRIPTVPSAIYIVCFCVWGGSSITSRTNPLVHVFLLAWHIYFSLGSGAVQDIILTLPC